MLVARTRRIGVLAGIRGHMYAMGWHHEPATMTAPGGRNDLMLGRSTAGEHERTLAQSSCYLTL